jgi:hypothetical protein
MAKKTTQHVVLVIDHVDRRDIVGAKIVACAGVLEPDEHGKRRVRYPQEAAGVCTSAGNLQWRWHRHDPRDSFDREQGPRVLTYPMQGACYEHSYYIRIDDAEAMLKGLRTVEKRMAALREKFGATEDFAETVVRIAAVFGAKDIAIDWSLFTEATGHGCPEWADDKSYKIIPVGDARAYLDVLARIDVTARCRTCKRPVADGQSRCYEHKEPIEQCAHDAVHGTGGEIH